MQIIMCDICGTKTRALDVRYVSIVKEDAEKDAIQIPMMAEKEICVHCAEHIKSYIEAMQSSIAEEPSVINQQ